MWIGMRIAIGVRDDVSNSGRIGFSGEAARPESDGRSGRRRNRGRRAHPDRHPRTRGARCLRSNPRCGARPTRHAQSFTPTRPVRTIGRSSNPIGGLSSTALRAADRRWQPTCSGNSGTPVPRTLMADSRPGRLLVNRSRLSNHRTCIAERPIDSRMALNRRADANRPGPLMAQAGSQLGLESLDSRVKYNAQGPHVSQTRASHPTERLHVRPADRQLPRLCSQSAGRSGSV